VTVWTGAVGRDDAILMISELVTNAVRHTNGLLLVLVSLLKQTLRVEVSDDDPELPATLRTTDDATSRRGLHIVDQLADRWGITSFSSGKTIWFEINLDSSDDPATDTS
jgi:signal transduction histidine kinase